MRGMNQSRQSCQCSVCPNVARASGDNMCTKPRRRRSANFVCFVIEVQRLWNRIIHIAA